MYEGVSTSVHTQYGEIDDFPITIGLHQGLNELALRCMLFANDIVLLG